MTQPTDDGVLRALAISGLQTATLDRDLTGPEFEALESAVAGCLFCRDHRGQPRGYLVTYVKSGLPGSAPGLTRMVESWTPCPVCRPRKK